MIDLRQIAAALGGEVSGQQVLAPGPGHSPRDRSLAVRLSANASAGFICHSHAGDDWQICVEHVRARLGLSPWRPGDEPCRKANGHDRTNSFVAVYDYVDENGELLFQVCRNPDKTFPQRKPDGKGGWIWKTGDVRKVLYRLPELFEAIASEHVIVIVEGEKDVENLRKIGVPATCSPGGAVKPEQKQKWRYEYSESLRGANIVIIPDHDEPGYAHAEHAARMSAGIAARVRILELAKHWPECPKGGDVSDWLAAGHTREELDALIESAPDFVTTQGETDKAAPETNERPKLPFINMSTWDRDPVPERQWAVQDRIPLKQTYLFTGNGAVGKSLVDLQRAVAHVLGKHWLGMPVRQGPAIYMGAEDDEDELHIRLAAILAYYEATFADVITGGLHLLSYVEEDCVLGRPNKNGMIEPTDLCAMLKEAALDIKPVAMMIDTVSDVYGGSEIDRGQTTHFIKLMNSIAVAGNCSVAILAHPSVAGMNTGTGLSGSTAWHNKVRARAYMKAMETERGDEPDPDAKSIQFMKNNYGRQGDTLLVRWQRGVYVLESAPNSLERLAEDQKVDYRFLQLLNQFYEQGRNLSDKKTAHAYAPKEFSEQRGSDGKRINKRHFEGAMQRLFDANKIHIENYGPASRGRARLAPGARPQKESSL